MQNKRWTPEQQKIAEDTIRFYAERQNSEVEYLSVGDNQQIEVYEEDKDKGRTAFAAAQLLGIQFNSLSTPKGYALIEAKKNEILSYQKTKIEKMTEIIPFYSLILSPFVFLSLLFLFPLFFSLLFAFIFIVSYLRWLFIKGN